MGTTPPIVTESPLQHASVLCVIKARCYLAKQLCNRGRSLNSGDGRFVVQGGKEVRFINEGMMAAGLWLGGRQEMKFTNEWVMIWSVNLGPLDAVMRLKLGI